MNFPTRMPPKEKILGKSMINSKFRLECWEWDIVS
jgi:hypothetical protein